MSLFNIRQLKMRRIFLLLLFWNCVYTLSAQEFNQAVINELQECIRCEKFDKGDSIINSFRDKVLPSISFFWLNLIHSAIGVGRYRQSGDINDYKKYASSGIDAFRFLSRNINKENAANSIDCWDFLFQWSKIYTQLGNDIVDSISVFSNRYYNSYEIKNSDTYYLVQHNIFEYYFGKQQYDKCIGIMSEVEKSIKNDKSAIIANALTHFYIGLAYMQLMDIMNSKKWFDSSLPCSPI